MESIAALTKITSDTPITYNSFNENETNDVYDNNSFTDSTIINAKESDTEGQYGIISKVTFQDRIVHEDRFLMGPTTMMNLDQIKAKYPGRNFPMTSNIIIPFGKTSLNGLKKLHKNTLSQITTHFNFLVFGGSYADEDKNPDELYPIDKDHLDECYDLYLMDDAIVNCKARELIFKNYGKTNYNEWKAFYDSELEKLKEDSDLEEGFISKIFNFSEYSKDSEMCPVYSIVSILRLVSGMINESPTLYKITMTIKINMNGYEDELKSLRENISEEELTIEINDGTWVFTAPKREDQGNKEDTEEEKQAKEFYDMMSNMGKKLQTQMQSTNPSTDTSNGFGLMNSILGADAPTDAQQEQMMKMFSNMFGGAMGMNSTTDVNNPNISESDDEGEDDETDYGDMPDLVEDDSDDELDEEY